MVLSTVGACMTGWASRPVSRRGSDLRSAAQAEFVAHSAVKPQVTALQAGVSGDIA